MIASGCDSPALSMECCFPFCSGLTLGVSPLGVCMHQQSTVWRRFVCQILFCWCIMCVFAAEGWRCHAGGLGTGNGFTKAQFVFDCCSSGRKGGV